MKRILFLLGIGLIFFASCEPYEDYLFDYEYAVVYFPIQQPLRSVVASNDMKIEFGAVLGGKRVNDKDEIVHYRIDPELLNNVQLFGAPLPFTLLPEDYYTLSDEREIIIPAGSFQGAVEMYLDSTKFVEDPDAIYNTYALPIVIESSSTDSILGWNIDPTSGDTIALPKDYSVIVIKYINHYHGYYYHKGRNIIFNDSGEAVDTITYSNVELTRNEAWMLSTSAGAKVLTSGLGHLATGTLGTFGAELAISGSQVTVNNTEGSDIQTIVSKSGRYSQGESSFYLEYEFTDQSGFLNSVVDTLIFRNDGILFEEW